MKKGRINKAELKPVFTGSSDIPKPIRRLAWAVIHQTANDIDGWKDNKTVKGEAELFVEGDGPKVWAAIAGAVGPQYLHLKNNLRTLMRERGMIYEK